MSKGDKTKAIRRAFAALGKDVDYKAVIDYVQRGDPKTGTPGLAVSRQQVFGVRYQVTPSEWRAWADERARSKAKGAPQPATKPAPPKATPPAGPKTTPYPPPVRKFDWEIVALLNTCVDRNKLVRLLTEDDMGRLDEVARQTGLAFDTNTRAFGLVGTDGGFCTCNV